VSLPQNFLVTHQFWGEKNKQTTNQQKQDQKFGNLKQQEEEKVGQGYISPCTPMAFS